MDAGSLSDVRENQSFKFTNTPLSSTDVVFSNQNSCFEKDAFSKLESIIKIQNLVKTMKSNSKNLSEMTLDGLRETPQNINSCLSESSSQKVLLTTLIDTITSCTHSMNVLQNHVKQCVPCSTKFSTKSYAPGEHEKIRNNYDVDDYGLIKVPIQDVVHTLLETLPTFFTDDSQLEEELKVLARKVSRAENTCDICVCELKTVWIIIQKMFLFLSLGNKKPEINYSIDELVSSLLSTNFPCGSESDSCHSVGDGDPFLSESISSIYLLPFVDDSCSSRSNHKEVKSSEGLESSESEFDSNENCSNLRRINTNFQHQYLKITHIETPYTSGEIGNENQTSETELNQKHVGETDFTSQRSSCASNSVKGEKYNFLNEVCQGKSFKKCLGKFWMSLDSIPRSKTSGRQQPGKKNKLSSISSTEGIVTSNEKSQPIQNTISKQANSSPNSRLEIDRESSYPNSRTTSSSFTNVSNFEHANEASQKSKKVRTDKVQVKITHRGEGFGLILGVKYHTTRSSIVPVIHSMKPGSPAQRTGVLKVGDRIIAINRRNTLGLTPNDLQVLSKQSFSAQAIILEVEFDVVEVEPQFGVFDVILDKTLKIGLLFEDMKRGYPMLVSGIVKGSGAHRCGQLFPGDKIKFLRCIRNEEFDTVSCNYSKEESVLITVLRDQADVWGKSANPSPCYFNPCFSHEDSVPRRGKSSIVKNKTVHTGGGRDALVLDQEVTLFRDPVYCDFGFMVGENRDTGSAYVTDVRPEGPAFDSGAMKKYDRIVQVNGVPVDRNVENSIMALMSQANHRVDLLIRRIYREDLKTV